MGKLILNKNNYIKLAIVLMIVGVALSITGFAIAGNKVENLKIKEKNLWYQTIHINDNNEARVYMKVGPIYIMNFGD